VKRPGVTVLAALSLTALVGGCSTGVDGTPQGGPATTSGTAPSSVRIQHPKQAGDELDCGIVTAGAVSLAVGQPAVVDPTGTRGNCYFTTRPADGSASSVVIVQVVPHPTGSPTKDFEGNSAYQFKESDKRCDLSVAVAKDKWLRASVQLFNADRGDVCAKAQALVNLVFVGMPDA
jgi:hypothetical protein